MPKIRSSADLRNNYNDISTFCHTYAEPVFITKNGKGDLAVMSIETYDRLVGRFELYSLMEKGINDVEQGRVQNADDAFARIEQKLGHGKDGLLFSHDVRRSGRGHWGHSGLHSQYAA